MSVPAARSLRFKAGIAVACFALYLAMAGAVVSWQRAKVTRIVEGLETLLQVEATLSRINTFSSHTVLRINETYLLSEPQKVAEAIELDIESIRAGLGGLGAWYPKSGATIAMLESALASARDSPARSSVIELRRAMQQLVADLDQLAREVRGRRDALWTSYRTTNDSVTLIGAGMFLFGVVAFGGASTIFFGRLAWDLRALAARAVDVVRGYRGEALEVRRTDEVGALMDAVNRMQHILREREQQIEVTRQQRFHQEKMVAIGSLAAAVAHEINNPIAAIEGVAGTIDATRRCGGCPEGVMCAPELILEHTRRIVGITRQLSEMSSPRSSEPEWIDLNALLRRTATFVSYDPRFRTVRMEFALDLSIPAVWAVSDHVTQTLMNLLINAADALLEADRAQRRLAIATCADGDRVRFTVRDNANGMTSQVLVRAFEESFTTKASGSGIGLFMCKKLVEGDGGSISIDSAPGEGTTVTVLLPWHAAGAAIGSHLRAGSAAIGDPGNLAGAE